NDPVELTEITLTPSERAEVVIDFSDMTDDKEIELITSDGEVLLPFQVENNDKDIKGDHKSDLDSKQDVTISENLFKQDVSKELVLFGHGHHVTIDGKKFDKDRIDLTQKKGDTEIWEVYNEPDMMG